MNVIELNQVSKTFGLAGGATRALDDVSLHVKTGEFLIIMGPSGCGKSTLLNVIGLLDHPDEGEYKLDNHDVAFLSGRRQAKLRRNNIGFIFQNFNLIGRITVLENVSLPLLYKGVSTIKRYERASEILKYLGIQEKEYYLPSQLSGGQLQRAAIARAMVNRPSIVLADEPTGNLDTASTKVIMAALREIHAAGNTIIMVTHNPDLAAYGDRVIKMLDGRIAQEFTGKSLTKELEVQREDSAEMVKLSEVESDNRTGEDNRFDEPTLKQQTANGTKIENRESIRDDRKPEPTNSKQRIVKSNKIGERRPEKLKQSSKQQIANIKSNKKMSKVRSAKSKKDPTPAKRKVKK